MPLLIHILEDLQAHLTLAQTWSEQGITDLPDWVKKYTTHVVGAISTCANAAAWAMDTQVPGIARLGLAAAGWAAKAWAQKQLARLPWLNSFKYQEGGRHYYEIHRMLRDLTRPTIEKIKEAIGQKINQAIRINFVIFIDDLDRCLPEKAVQTLELIKTVFNIESFAFVLALDDEVIERGIGHRYKEYKLQDKKPEMPITGFEYLEKIVHLPFRLPELTREQAMDLIRIKELELQPAPDSSLSPIEQETQDKRLLIKKASGSVNSMAINAAAVNSVMEKESDHFKLLIESFDHYVPRKLIRSVELLYQVSRIASERGRPFSSSKGSDSYILFALILLQLFQPELFRVVRRKETSLVSFLGAFLGKSPFWNGHQDVSEVSLWQWAVEYQPQRLGNNQQNIPAPNDLTSSIAYLSAVPPNVSRATYRYYAQQVRLPLVQRLVEHMQVERHAFNPFKWAKELATQLGEERVRNLDIRYYNQYLSQQKEGVYASANIVLSTKMSAYATTRPNHGVKISFYLLDNIYDRSISKDLGLQSELRTLLEPYQGQVFDDESTDYLLNKLQASEDNGISMLRGLTDLAPHIDIEQYGKEFWALVSGLGNDWLPDPNIPNNITPDPVNASLYLDVQSMLGQDDRFDREETFNADGQSFKPLYLLKNRWNLNDETQEPIPGFVRFEGGIFTSGFEDAKDNKINTEANVGSAFYMARLPTTVNQFEAFIADGGYGENPEDSKAKSYWDEQGWAWRHSSASFVHHLNGTDQHELLKLRIGNLRSLPWDWARQQRVGSRAVTGINWFEARAYARWLNEQFQKRGLLLDNLPGYAVRLPSEWQWELAARGTNPQRWPWGDDESFANQRANLRNSGIDHPNVFGCFAPNNSGLCDLAGNVHEWQDGLFFKAGVSEKDYERLLLTNSELPKGQVQAVNDTRFQHLPRTYLHLLTNDSYLFDLVAARGGSYEVNSRIAACSFRDFYMADFWLLTLGFRIALSKV